MPSSGVQTCRSEEHTSELQSHSHLVCRLLLEKKKIHNRAQTKHSATPYTTKRSLEPALSRSLARQESLMPLLSFLVCFVACFFFFFFLCSKRAPQENPPPPRARRII